MAFSIETHLHADFVTGSRELAAFGATVVVSAAASVRWPHQPVAAGETVDLGGLSLRVLATPGHTPEHLAYLLADGDEVLGGDPAAPGPDRPVTKNCCSSSAGRGCEKR